MASSVTQRAVQLTSKAASELGLKAAGFRRQGIHFHRQVDGLFHGVNFQSSRWGSVASGKFTVNFCVSSPTLVAVLYGTKFPSNPGAALFPINQRIGDFMEPRRDHWWEVDERADASELAREAARSIVVLAPTFFARFTSRAATLALLRSGKGPGLTAGQIPLVQAVLAAEFGELEDARRTLEEARASTDIAGFRAHVVEVARRLGLELP
ncbi:MAG: DUF4304 domain-containing protein [Planctomycetes bacterium]|nr:DUF4304 domain-containing protein [Planctomycetota bacterium]